MVSRLAGALALVVVLAAAALVVQHTWLAAAPPGAPPAAGLFAGPGPVAPAPVPEVVRVGAVEGKVERQGGDGVWRPAQTGEILAAADVIRTDVDSAAEIEVGKLATVRVDSESQISVPSLTATVTRLQLGQGRVSAVVPGGGGRTFGVAVQGSDAVAETAAGEFAVLTGGAGEAVVQVTAGTARFTASQQTVSIGAGEQSSAAPGAPPVAVQKIPSSLFLKVHRPGDRVLRDRQLAVRGSASPGAVVSINGVRLLVREDGAFVQEVSLREGSNTVVVEGRDVAGRRTREQLPVVVDSRGPQVRGAVKWGGR